MASKAVPKPTPETQPYWDAARAGELRIQRCTACGEHYFYPRPFCPRDGSDAVEWVTVSGRATLHSYVISHRPAPGFEDEVPYAIALVQLAEGPRMMTNIVGIENTPEKLVLDMELEVDFQDRGDLKLPVFRPARGAAGGMPEASGRAAGGTLPRLPGEYPAKPGEGGR